MKQKTLIYNVKSYAKNLRANKQRTDDRFVCALRLHGWLRLKPLLPHTARANNLHASQEYETDLSA